MMENAIDIFNNNIIFRNKNICIILDNKNNPWFKGKDIAEILEYKDTKNAIKKHVDEEDKSKYGNFLKGGKTSPFRGDEKNAIFINESGLYSLILKSKKEEAKRFKKWVTKEVLPEIRKTGEYRLQKEKDQLAIELKNKDEEIEKLKFKHLQINNFIYNIKIRKKTDKLYIATTLQYSKNNNFKIGFTKDLKSRLNTYNTGRNSNDLYYYVFHIDVFEAKKLDHLIQVLLADFKDTKNKELYIIHYLYLENLIKLFIRNYNEMFDYTNGFIKNDLNKMYELKPFIPDSIN